MNSLWQKSRWMAGVGWRLILKELRQNMVVFLTPLLFFVPIVALSLWYGSPVHFGAKTSIIGIIIAFVFAVIYGLQSFAGETDRKTIDFLLSRPISPIMLIAVKFLINLGIYLIWLILIAQRTVFDWSLLKLPKGVDGNAIGLIFPLVVSMGFFAGLIARGAERLVVTAGLAGLMAGGSYFLWNQAFLLMAANYYWFDIPPHIVVLVSRWIPAVLLLISLATPLVFSLWFLRGRYTFYKFKPFRHLASVWVIITLAIWVSVIFLGPAVWPLERAPHGGDWHPKSGVVITGSFFKPHFPVSSLYLARIGGKAHPVYKGSQIHSARWSPDGKSIAFVDGSWIKIWHKAGVQSIIRGSFPYWSHDNQNLAFVQKPDRRHRFNGVYVINLKKKSIQRLYGFQRMQLLALAWDSRRNMLYLLHEDEGNDLLEIIDLKIHKKIHTINFKASPMLFMQNPTLTLGFDGTLLLGLSYEHTSKVSALYPGAKTLDLLNESKDLGIDMLSQNILSPVSEGYLVPRMDGAYDYRGFIPPEDEDEHEHEHEILH